MKSIFLITFFLLITVKQDPLFAQEYIYKHFTTADGLPSSEVYHVFQDSKGYIWFATDNGVSKYNGYEFENFHTNDGLATNSISEVYEDYKGRIWFIGMNSKLSYFQNDTIYSFKYNNLISENLRYSPIALKKAFYVDLDDNIYLSVKSSGLIKVSATGNIHLFDDLDNDTITQIIHELTDGKKIPALIENSYLIFNKLSYKFGSKVSITNLEKSQNRFPHHIYLHQVKQNKVCFTSGQYFYVIENKKIISYKKFSNDIIWSSNQDDGVWACPFLGGAHFFNISKKTITEKYKLLDGKSVSSVLKDRNGGYWFSTLSSGVFYLESFNIKVWNTLNNHDRNRIECVEANENIVWIGYNNNTISVIDGENIADIKMKSPYSFGINDLYYEKENERLIVASSGYIYFVKPNEIKTLKNNYYQLAPIYNKAFTSTGISPDNSKGYWIGGGHGFFHMKNDVIDFDSRFKKNFRIRVNAILEDKNGSVWIGSKDGLRILKDNKIEHLGSKFPELNSCILDIVEYDSLLIFATKGNGILFFDKAKVWQVAQNDGLAANTVVSLAISNRVIWAGSLNGLSEISLKNKRVFCKTITELSSFEIHDIKPINEKLLLATNKGLVEYTRNKQPEEKINPLILKHVKVNGKTIPFERIYQLSYEENNITIIFEALSYPTGEDIKYKYKLKGLDENWIQTNERVARYYHLEPGDYEFNVMIKESDLDWKKSAEKFKLKITPAIWQTAYFKIAITLFVLSVLLLLVKVKQASNKHKLTLRQSVYNYMNQAMKAQIHPHFIFNTLNSINKFILTNNKKSASLYLTKFSKLIRKVLEYSQRENVTLTEEIHALELYLSIEAMRLKNKFTYSIQVDSDIETSGILMPSLLLQPFVENSIWHGIQPLDKKGVIKIQISKNGPNLEATIIDNGIGRVKSDEIMQKRKLNKKSIGIAITKKRLEILAKKQNCKTNLEYTDLYSKNTCIGTKVKISMPVIRNKENWKNQT
jgi:ligand-binding sensor domain-containing protein